MCLLMVLMSVMMPMAVQSNAQFKLDTLQMEKPLKPPSNSEKRIVSTATNSPIYYISKVDLPSFFLELLPQAAPNKKKPGMLQEDLASFLSGLRKTPSSKKPLHTMTTTRKSIKTTPFPFQRLPISFVSNAKPVGSYKLKVPSEIPLKMMTTTTQPPTVQRITTSSSSLLNYTPSKIIRLKTKFVSNGQPSSVYVFKSPFRRYSLKDIRMRPLVPPKDNRLTKDVKTLSSAINW